MSSAKKILTCLIAALVFLGPVTANESAVAGSAKDRDLLGKDDNADGVRDDLAAYVRTISEDAWIERDLLYLAKARTQAMLTDPQDRDAVRAALDRAFAAKACLGRDIGEFHYQMTLVNRIDSALLNTPMRVNAMRRVMDMDRNNLRSPQADADGLYACPYP